MTAFLKNTIRWLYAAACVACYLVALYYIEMMRK